MNNVFFTPDMDPEDNKKDKSRQELNTLVKKELWKRIPLTVKLYILGGIGAFLLIVIFAAAILGLMPSIFLNYSDDVTSSQNVKDAYEEYWTHFCEDGDKQCNDEQIEEARKFKASQEKFYKKLEALSKNFSNEQKYIVLSTIFYNYDIDSFTDYNGAFEIDETDEINYDVNTSDKNIYTRETDSLKELFKQFKVNTAICYYDERDESGNLVEKSESLQDANGKAFLFNYFDNFMNSLGKTPTADGFAEAKSSCESRTNGKVRFEVSSSSQASVDAYYKYLEGSDYLDLRPQNASDYANYAKSNNLSNDISTWPEEDKIEVRKKIVEEIKSIVEDYSQSSSPTIAIRNSGSYWWPIGSVETTEINGVTFASGDPEFIHINSPYGYRSIGVYNYQRRLHAGVDLQGSMGSTNIIASLAGTVVKINNTCASTGSKGCGGGYGNYVQVTDSKGNLNVYAHMYKDSLTVKVGDTVSQGQVLGKVGNSGNSSGAHLHFSIYINGSPVDPMKYLSMEDPRPVASAGNDGEYDFFSTPYTKEEFVAKVHEWYTTKASCKSKKCQDMKRDVLSGNGAEDAYDIATSMNMNPETIFVRSHLEGYDPGTGHNYFGYACYNVNPKCSNFGTFKDAVTTYYNTISKFDSLYSMMYKYAYIGDYWYKGNSGSGGCYYKDLIYPNGAPERVNRSCSSNCTGSACEPTTDEDQAAYATYNVGQMIIQRRAMFG